jgi:hypothetical protein
MEFIVSCQTFNFKKEARVYIVYNSNKYFFDVSEINFSQTFTEQSYDVKTIQEQLMFDGSVINKANPGNFTIRFPALRESDLRILFDLALNINTFDIYVETELDLFQLEYCAIESGNFVLERTLPLTMEVSGSARKVSKFGDSGDAIPGSPISRSVSRTYNRISDLDITIGATNISQLLQSVSIELKNSIEWTPYTTINGAIQAELDNSAQYPNDFTVRDRTLSGEIVQYLTDDNNQDFLDWSTDTTLQIQAGQVDGSFYGFNFDLQNVTFDNSINTGQIFTQRYKWRLTQNPNNLSDIVTYAAS